MSGTTNHDSSKKTTAHENLLEILDNVIHQLDLSKKLAIIMLVSFFTVIPVSAIIIFRLSTSDAQKVAIPVIAISVFLVWLAVGVRQWIVFSKWTKKYRLYKELQRKLDERLDFENKTKGETP